MTLFQLLNEGSLILQQAGDPDPQQDARMLLLAAFQLDMVHYLLKRMEPLADHDVNRSGTGLYREMIEKRRRRCPLQQILGSQEFMGLTFYVNNHVLIPRQDTESLVELVLAEQPDPALKLLDLCTGSGCIAISLMVKGGYQAVTATDISPDALAVARQNGEALCSGRPGLQFLEGDLFAALAGLGPEERTFDVITANPPYIPTAVLRTLEPEVKDHEPLLALDGDTDGLHCYRRIAAEARQYMGDGAAIYLEIGYDQGPAVSELFWQQGYGEVRVSQDLAGNDRIVSAVSRCSNYDVIKNTREVPHV